MSKSFQHALFLCLCFIYVSSFPRNGLIGQEMQIDCDNVQLVNVLQKIKVPFRCLRNSNELVDDGKFYKKNKYNQFIKRYGENRRPLKVTCPAGTTYLQNSHECIPTVPKKLEVLSLIGKPSYVKQLPKSEKKCEKGTQYKPQTNSCHPINRECKPGTVYNPSIDLCLSINPTRPIQSDQPYKLDYKSKVTTEEPFKLTISPIKRFKVGRRMCRKGYIYVSEVDMCLEP